MNNDEPQDWRPWYWVCECGNKGDADGARWTVTERGTVLMLCPECGRKVDLPGSGSQTPVKIDAERARELRNKGLTLRAVARELGASHEGVRGALRRRNRKIEREEADATLGLVPGEGNGAPLGRCPARFDSGRVHR